MRFASLAETAVWAVVCIVGFAIVVMVTVMSGNLIRDRNGPAEVGQPAVISEAASMRVRCNTCTTSTATPTPEPPSASENLVGLETNMIDLEFALAVLVALELDPTVWSVRFLDEWARNEGAGAARYNPLATTKNAPGSTCYNDVCVRHYPDFETGVTATVATLQQGSFAPIRDSLGADAITDRLAVEGALRRWGTVLLADKVVAGWSPEPN